MFKRRTIGRFRIISEHACKWQLRDRHLRASDRDLAPGESYFAPDIAQCNRLRSIIEVEPRHASDLADLFLTGNDLAADFDVCAIVDKKSGKLSMHGAARTD